MPSPMTGRIGFEVEHITTYIVNRRHQGSQGRHLFGRHSRLNTCRRWYDVDPGGHPPCPSAGTLPQKEELESIVDQVMRDLAALRKAPVLEPTLAQQFWNLRRLVFFSRDHWAPFRGRTATMSRKGRPSRARSALRSFRNSSRLRDDPTESITMAGRAHRVLPV